MKQELGGWRVQYTPTLRRLLDQHNTVSHEVRKIPVSLNLSNFFFLQKFFFSFLIIKIFFYGIIKHRTDLHENFPQIFTQQCADSSSLEKKNSFSDQRNCKIWKCWLVYVYLINLFSLPKYYKSKQKTAKIFLLPSPPNKNPLSIFNFSKLSQKILNVREKNEQAKHQILRIVL